MLFLGSLSSIPVLYRITCAEHRYLENELRVHSTKTLIDKMHIRYKILHKESCHFEFHALQTHKYCRALG